MRYKIILLCFINYICEPIVAYNTVPLVPIKELKGDVTKLLPSMRATFSTWANTHTMSDRIRSNNKRKLERR